MCTTCVDVMLQADLCVHCLMVLMSCYRRPRCALPDCVCVDVMIQVDPGVFWNSYYLIVFLLMLSFVVKARMRNGEWGPADQELEVSVLRLSALKLFVLLWLFPHSHTQGSSGKVCQITPCLSEIS